MSANISTELAALGLEPTFSTREAAALLKRSYSWLDQRLRQGEFVRPDGTIVQPLRSPGGYRYFSIEMIRDIATSLIDCLWGERRLWWRLNGCRSVYLRGNLHHRCCGPRRFG
jgi:hypothetical protein